MQKFHLALDELDDILAKGFQDSSRRSVALAHLCGPCATCRACLGRRATEAVLDSPIVRDDEQDAVVWALRREILMKRLGDSVLAELRPGHSHWARQTGKKPLAFARLVLEESFEAGLAEPAQAVTIAEKSLRSLEEASALAEVKGASYQDVHALACAYVADARQEMGDFEAAAELFRRAGAILATDGSTAPATRYLRAPRCGSETGFSPLGFREGKPALAGLEVLATVEELRAGLELAQALPWRALERLEVAGGLLQGVRIPGRWSEHLLRRGRVLSQLKRFAEAREALAEALAALPVPSSPRLQLEIIHHQAALELQDGDWGRAYGLLIEFKDLYFDHGAPLMNVQRCWLLARISYLMRCDQLARPRFQLAFDGFLRLGREVEALHVLMDLIRCCVRMKIPADEFLTLRKDLHRLLESPACRQVSGEIWRRFLREALEEGWSLPWMKDLLDGSPGPPVH